MIGCLKQVNLSIISVQELVNIKDYRTVCINSYASAKTIAGLTDSFAVIEKNPAVAAEQP